MNTKPALDAHGSPSPVIVIGMHRSGTSLFAELLSDMGVHMGREVDNHNEARFFKDLNNQLLFLKGAHWARPQPFVRALADSGFRQFCEDHVRRALSGMPDSYGEVLDGMVWGWKDPRNTLTLPVWLRVFPAARVIHIVRNGVDVALSLHRREIRRWFTASTERRLFPPTLGACFRLWDVYVRMGCGNARLCSATLRLRFEDILDDPAKELQEVAGFVGLKADPSHLHTLSRRRLRRPARRTAFDELRVRVLERAGALRVSALREMGC